MSCRASRRASARRSSSRGTRSGSGPGRSPPFPSAMPLPLTMWTRFGGAARSPEMPSPPSRPNRYSPSPRPSMAPDPPPTIDRAALGIPDGPMFLFCFDLLSVMERKNPLGLIDAFTRAFAPGEGPVLVLKTVNGARKVGDMERLRLAAAPRPDVVVLDRYLDYGHTTGLMAALRMLRVAPPQRGPGTDDGRGHGPRQARRRHRVLRQHGLHDEGDGVSRSVVRHRRPGRVATPIHLDRTGHSPTPTPPPRSCATSSSTPARRETSDAVPARRSSANAPLRRAPRSSPSASSWPRRRCGPGAAGVGRARSSPAPCNRWCDISPPGPPVSPPSEHSPPRSTTSRRPSRVGGRVRCGLTS